MATETFAPNCRIAHGRLSCIGVDVVRTGEAPDNLYQRGTEQRGALPFRDHSFRLIVCRNSSFLMHEVSRVLAPGGKLLIEMTGGKDIPEICALLQLQVTHEPVWGLEDAKQQASAVGFRVVDGREGRFTMEFLDVGALIWYLRAIPWVAPGFDVQERIPQLRRIHASLRSQGSLRVVRTGFWMQAAKPA